jgi:N-acetylglutamate synthase-like GNAT family acetyltransferase
MPDSSSPITVRAAQPADKAALSDCIDLFIQQGKLLPRTADELESLLTNFFIAEVEGRLVGCAALEVYSKKLAEIRSLAVLPEAQRQGVGRQLVAACVARAREKNILEVMAITSSEEFFQACGFEFTLPGEKKALFLQTRDR